jgi:hypothetical protein
MPSGSLVQRTNTVVQYLHPMEAGPKTTSSGIQGVRVPVTLDLGSVIPSNI